LTRGTTEQPLRRSKHRSGQGINLSARQRSFFTNVGDE
jgi:hypothetical protein